MHFPITWSSMVFFEEESNVVKLGYRLAKKIGVEAL
jgi:hypothetical protein